MSAVGSPVHRAILTGASGGIGAAIARAIAPHCTALVLVGRDKVRLEEVCNAVQRPGLYCRVVACDLTTANGREALAKAAADIPQGPNLLINNAGTGEFGWFADQNDESIARILGVNALAPMLLTRRLLPLLQRQRAATVLNVGSIFGYLGYPGCATYSASKFALRGFSEALRRELADGPVRVVYFAPRATRTALNDTAINALNERLGTAVDSPERVAEALMRLLKRPVRERLLGMPERFFARVNQILPALVDSGLRKQLDIIRSHARRGVPRPAVPATSLQSSEGAKT
ncbi:MAG: SDR family oxidoreductase [Burkholderiaceae bacterium]